MRSERAPKLWERVEFWGESRMSYAEIRDFQLQRLDAIVRNEARETLIFCEHEDVLTKGRRTHDENILKTDLPVYEIERGGDVTWHGPGQLVVYPLFRLQGHLFQKGLHEFLRFCEEAVIRILKNYQLDAGRYGPTGVWIKNSRGEIKKIASIGIAVRRWVTYHGISINVSNSFEGFSQIRPCNFESQIMTSLANEGITASLSEVANQLEAQMTHLLRSDGHPVPDL